ncbi:hypothetical protein TVAG_054890 [Trichomonas vaginalis G3]|uniref:Uncharacterized protein n=1 Tax=Trichomonas vaginalis (strain ATCC PRA-98 / G3) TaxID=412133 RepID=A2FHW8_TRIV3|nr:hypothetical protein TVAGG3_0833740 [Trichomonas vaginalis G3]EAX95510.1 hypothetical protein TVAG_054890 [Trichomonas vaginalis G3]KAI5498766.1 hypothetical protein TVAGG3_0833740 [Trichomonas vaginalis G3]|eukprot:XP_001308440.1 hypothetical protein [Trichomonas vaginalis G3]
MSSDEISPNSTQISGCETSEDEIENIPNDFFETQEDIDVILPNQIKDTETQEAIDIDPSFMIHSSPEDQIEKINSQDYFKREFITFIISEDISNDLELWDCSGIKVLRCIYENSYLESQNENNFTSVTVILNCNKQFTEIEGAKIYVFLPFKTFYYNHQFCLITPNYTFE